MEQIFMNIDTNIILKALAYYQSIGYELVSVPYLVEPKYSKATSPDGRVDLEHNGKVYVASAEQGFLQMLDKGLIPKHPKKYCAITPCYRDEDILNDTHYNIFLKIELFGLYDNFYQSMMCEAMSFMHKNGVATKTERVDVNQIDLISVNSGVELGSYGRRLWEGISYDYGTGLAEPRFSLESDL